MRLTIGNLSNFGARKRERKRSATILARKPPELNPPYAAACVAAGAGYKVGTATVTRRAHIVLAFARTKYRGDPVSHRHFAMQNRRAKGEAFGGIDNRVGIDPVVAVEVVDRAGLAELRHAERFHPVPAHAAEPAERRRMAVDHGDDPAVARQRRQELFDMAQMLHAAAIAAQFACRGPARM